MRFLPLFLCLVVSAGCARRVSEPPAGTLTISKEQEASWVRNFNPLSPGVVRWPAKAGIYEPLLVHSAARGAFVPWLATAWSFSQDLKHLTFTLREGVKWSDGAPFSADDVAFTFGLLKKHPALDSGGIHTFVSGVARISPTQVRFDFKRPFVPGLEDIGIVPIVPKHAWKNLPDPVIFANPNPIATGPFTEILRFTPQEFVLGRNPHYWQPGKPALKALRFPAYPSNDQANLALVTGEVDWAGNFVPAIDRTFVGRDPKHHHYWFPLSGSTVFLYANTTRGVLADVRVRKAISMGIDRELLVRVASYGYSRPADATGMSDAWPGWKDPAIAAHDWVRHQPDKARAMLKEAGAQDLTVEILVVSGWSDWVRAAQVVSRQLQNVGIKARVRALDFSPWMEALQKGDFDLAISWSDEGATPYRFYRSLMSPRAVKPVGETTASNWHRFGDPEAGRLLEQVEATGGEAEQKALLRQVQARFSETAPAIPLYPNPQWGSYNTRRATGFPSASNPYATLSPNKEPEQLLILTTLKPVAP